MWLTVGIQIISGDRWNTVTLYSPPPHRGKLDGNLERRSAVFSFLWKSRLLMVEFVQALVALLVGFQATCTAILKSWVLSSSKEGGLYIPRESDSFQGILIFLKMALVKLWVPVCSQRFSTRAILSSAMWFSKNVLKTPPPYFMFLFFCQIITNTKGEFWAHFGLIHLFYLILNHEAFGKKIWIVTVCSRKWRQR